MAAGHDDATEIIGLEDTVAATAGEEVAQRLLRPFRLRASHGRRLGHPMTTDIAFSPGMLALLGSRVPDASRSSSWPRHTVRIEEAAVYRIMLTWLR